MTFQERVQAWARECFGPLTPSKPSVRSHRFLEEALELVQACELPKEEALKLVEYVYNRPVGEKYQEVGGVMITLAGLCSVHGLDFTVEGEKELERIWTTIPQIRAKQASKPGWTTT